MLMGELTVCSSKNLVIGRQVLESHLRTITLKKLAVITIFSAHGICNLLPPRTVFSRTWEMSLLNASIQEDNSFTLAGNPVGALFWVVLPSLVKDMRNWFLLWDKHQWPSHMDQPPYHLLVPFPYHTPGCKMLLVFCFREFDFTSQEIFFSVAIINTE